jgi:hypothetical protein
LPAENGKTIHVIPGDGKDISDLSKFVNLNQSLIYINSGKVDNKKSKIVINTQRDNVLQTKQYKQNTKEQIAQLVEQHIS